MERKQRVNNTSLERSSVVAHPLPPTFRHLPPPSACKRSMIVQKGVGHNLHAPSPCCRVPPGSLHVSGGGTLFPIPCGAFAPTRLRVQTGNAWRRAKVRPPSLSPRPAHSNMAWVWDPSFTESEGRRHDTLPVCPAHAGSVLGKDT